MSILHEVERLAQKLDADAVDVAEYVHVETLGSIVWDTKRAKLILCPLFPRRYLVTVVSEYPDHPVDALDDPRPNHAEVLRGFFGRKAAWASLSDRAILGLALQCARDASLSPWMARRFGDATCRALLLRRGVRVHADQLPAINSDRDTFRDVNRGFGLSALDAAVLGISHPELIS